MDDLLDDQPGGQRRSRIGPYDVLDRLGTGGSGSVYLARRDEDETRYAVKLMHRTLDGSTASRRAFRELDLLESEHIPSTPRFQEYGFHDDQMYLVHEFVDGDPLDLWMEQHTDGSVEDVVRMVVKVCRAVEQIHERQIVHRDLKPSNVLIGADGTPTIIDLGIARVLEDRPGQTVTMDGAALGTLGFMSPEQARGESGTVSFRTDVYGLGATLFSLLTGQTPHDLRLLEQPAALRTIGYELPRSLRSVRPGISKDLDAIVGKATAFRPQDRFASVTEFADDLQRWLDHRAIVTRPPSVLHRTMLSMHRRPAIWAVSAVAAVLLLSGGGVGGAILINQEIDQRALQRWTEALDKSTADSMKMMTLTTEMEDYKNAQFFIVNSQTRERNGINLGPGGVEQLRDAEDKYLTGVLWTAFGYSMDGPTVADVTARAIEALYREEGLWSDELAADVERFVEGLPRP